ncbi:DUF7134 domain-containing protein [Actinoplanes xinjiangensis]|uniref:DUF7134 domain-containing protein n=1 Tax=Actinoplanes xinjiangensis TaxID=512350 RepID=A0A316F4E9_9ACTN|nr:hypothetical protein [Actinoplanes xinjiangensis]PWK31494.1 hypothetical protein BC793_13333 [Actinoplanes xinjiangensis]GIF44009.1 hypothetical protein Axi01nite_83200 [Actinoplanes xinjiangensis]
MISRHPHAFDLALATVLTCGAFGLHQMTAARIPTPPLTTADLLGAVPAFLAIAGRRRRPRAVLLTVTAGLVGHYSATQHGHPLLVLAIGIVAYTVAAETDRRTTLLLAAGCGTAVYVGNAVAHAHPVSLQSLPTLTFISWLAPTAVSKAARQR